MHTEFLRGPLQDALHFVPPKEELCIKINDNFSMFFQVIFSLSPRGIDMSTHYTVP